MAVSQVPAAIDALISLSDAALSGVLALDGVGVTDDPGDYLMVGVSEPDAAGGSTAATARQVVATMGTTRSRQETGSIWCAAYSWTGDSGNAGQKAARDAAFATVAAVENLLRTNPSLDLTAGGLFVAQLGEVSPLEQDQGTWGASALVVFSVDFQARI